MPHPTRSETVKDVFRAYRTRDRRLMEQTLTEDFTFTSPYDDAIDRKAFFERCWPAGQRMAEISPEEIVENGDRVFVLYRCRTREGKEFRNVETLDFTDDRIRAVNVYFGAAYIDGVFQPS
ncbi:nuclear transport factor 2 family protein [Chelativorans xinjiangense]|uniref:nuclear transport factor 2 family protein n=1 Tax=Chelativorans xinjiangense TaxID=2681485 RepID=UPI00135A095C|nr:nuclear transport factor 2 family protein [Chelativorans xinjiangense]